MFRLRHLVFTTLLTATFAIAQLPVSKADLMQEGVKRLDTIAKKLKLSPDQIEKIRPLLQQQMQDVGAAREKFAASDKSDAAKKEALGSIQESRTKNKEEISKVLTPEQAGKWDDMTKAWKNDLKFDAKSLPAVPTAV